MKKVNLEEAVGCRLGHDLTEVVPEKRIKRRLFRRGHVITTGDLERLRDLGKNTITIWEADSDGVHEDDAAVTVAPLIAGKNIRFDPEPSEGKISFYATCSGVFKVDVERLHRINALEIPSLPTLFTHSPVEADKQVAAFRIIPLTCDPSLMDQLIDLLHTPLISVVPYRVKKAGIIVTGNEVYEGRIQDGFIPGLTALLSQYGTAVVDSLILPDDRIRISEAVSRFSETCDIILVTGGTSVDPDDQTVAGLLEAGVKYHVKGNPIQPGNNLTIGYRGETCVCAVPAASLHYRATALDVFLPRILAGETVSREDVHRAGHGGLCHFCDTCHYPICPFAVSH